MNRIAKIIPGVLIWLALISPFVLSYAAPNIYGYAVILLASYWLLRAVMFVYGLIVGYYNYSKAVNTDWLAKIKELNVDDLPNLDTLPNDKLPKHLIVIPTAGAGFKTLKRTIDAIVNQNYPKELVYVSLSFEERLVKAKKEYHNKLKQELRKEYINLGDRFMIFDHPANIPGEAIGAAANRSWGNSAAAGVLEKRGENLQDFITTSPDEDVCLHPEYLGALSYQYLKTPKRLQRFYQTAVYLFTNNYWEVPSLIRTWSMSISLPVMASSVTHRTWRETWSCYSINLQVLKNVNYWDTSIGIDDTPFYWRPFDHFDGEFECEIIYTPLYADAVYHPNKYKNYIEQYKQLIRWGWGVVAFPRAIEVFVRNKNISLPLKLQKLAIMIEVFVLAKIASVVFTISIPLLMFFHNTPVEAAQIYQFAFILSAIMQLMALSMLPMLYYKFKFAPQHATSKFKHITNFIFEIPLQFIILYTFGLLPFLVGPTLMMFGKEHKYNTIEKF